MIPLKSIVIYSALVCLLFLNFFFIWKCQVFFVDTNKRELHTSELKTQEFLEPERPKTLQYQTGSRYKFLSPHVSLRVLKELTKDIQLPNTDMELYGNGQIYLGFKQDSAYCEKRLAHFVQNPSTLFNETNIVHSQNSLSFTSSVVSSFAKDLHAASITLKQLTGKTFFDMMPSIGAFFTGIPMYFFYDINKQAGCLSQMANHIPGCDNLARRPKLLQTIPTYLMKYENRPQCLAPNSIFPQTWVLSDKAMCEEFFDKINSPEYQKLKQERNIVYVKKLPKTPTTTGIILFNEEEEDKLITEYQNGALCGQTNTDVIMQQYIQNTLLLNGQKFDFKSYLFIASTNPLVAYYHDGLLRVSVPNDQISADLALDKQIANIMNGEMVDPEEQLREAQQWSFARLQTYLLEKKLTKDKNWLDSYLRPEIKKVMVHLVRMSADKFARHSSFYGFFEVDFMLDEDLKLWFVEVISGPAFSGYSKTSEKIIAQMMKDHFEIVFGLLRSRMKRVVNFVNSLVEQRTAYQTEAGKLVIENLEESKAIFKDITKNYFEKEYEPSRTNGFEKIIDEDYVGSAVYQGYLDKNCL